jgi:rhodanese-related sulfurtransferase
MKINKVFFFLVLFLSILFGITACTKNIVVEIIDVKPSEAAELISKHINDPDFVVLDIRTPDEFSTGHIPGAINIDYYSPDFSEQIRGLEKIKEYLLYCRTGNRSGKALDIMKKFEFRKVYHLTAGIVGWQSAGFSLAP